MGFKDMHTWPVGLTSASQLLLFPAQGKHYTDQRRPTIFPCKQRSLGSPSCVIYVPRIASPTRGNLSGLKWQCLAITRIKYSIVTERIVRAVLQLQKPFLLRRQKNATIPAP